MEGEVDLSVPDKRTIVIEGTQTFDIRDYGVDPPKSSCSKCTRLKVRVKVFGERQG
ncbi:MAG: hypothetical protein ACRDYX_04935 [Egibacteraceae bacterium]